MNNKKMGNSFERELCNELFRRGFWVHNLTQSKTGQPSDIIAVRNGLAFLIDCKVCMDDSFKVSRIEDNQHSAMTLWQECGNGIGWFAFQFSDGTIFFLDYAMIKALTLHRKSLPKSEIAYYGMSLARWAKC